MRLITAAEYAQLVLPGEPGYVPYKEEGEEKDKPPVSETDEES